MENPELLSPHLISVIKIKTISLYIDEFNIPENALFKIDFNRNYSIDVNQELVIINLDVTYSVPKNENERRPVLSCLVHNVFRIDNIKGFMDKTGLVKLPLTLLSSLIGLSITHTRAIISVHTAGTALGDTLLPVINPTEAAKALFDEAN